VLARDVEGHGGVAALVVEGGVGDGVPSRVNLGRRGDGVVVDGGEEVEERGEGVVPRLVAQLEGVEGGPLLDGFRDGGLGGELEGLGVEVAEVGGVGDLGSSAGGRG